MFKNIPQEVTNYMKKISYSGKKTNEISFPLGGIGTGCIGLLGNGRLADFEIFGKPNKKCLAGLSFFSVKAEKDGKFIDARILNTDSESSRTGFEQYADEKDLLFNGYGYGPASSTLSGVPHFPSSDFSVSFPYAEMNFSYEKFPGKIKMLAFNPFIPLNDSDSSIPAAMFEFEIKNDSSDNIDYTLCGALENPLQNCKNTFDGDIHTNMKCIRLHSYDDIIDDGALDSPYNAKNLCIATDAEYVSYQEYFFRGTWFDKLQTFWNDFTQSSFFKNRSYLVPGEKDPGVISAHFTLAPGQKKNIRFVISWYMRYLSNYWLPIPKAENEDNESYLSKNRWRNYYVRFFSSSLECAAYCFAHWDRLNAETKQFTESLYSSTVPNEIIEAVASNLCILKSSTILRHSDGNIIGFEGSHAKAGSCEGNCSHVYNYAYALAHLFPKLERGLRESEFLYCMDDDGALDFRVPAPLGRHSELHFPCVDGQMGAVIKTYREFKLSGDEKWLKKMWPYVKKSIDFTFSSKNCFRWDPDRSGIIRGRQHNTLDTELFSPSSWLQGMYTLALLSASEMAEIVKDKKSAAEYRCIFEKAKKYLNTDLFNGKYFFQKIDLTDKSLIEGYPSMGWYDSSVSVSDYYWSDEYGEIKYQIGEGSAIDQTLAQWHANNIGLGEIYEKDKLLSALDTIYNLNFKKTMRDFFNPCRNFCINDEAGVTICTYPENAKKPKIPIPYAEECMNGFEYQAACLMIQSGMVKEGLDIVKAIRKRYDGEYRNPFSEMECGSSYVRSLASYTLINAFSGLGYDLYNESISFNPLIQFSDNGYFKCFFAAGEAYGTIEIGPKYVEMKILSGEIKLRKFGLFAEPKVVYYGGRKFSFKPYGNTAVFDVSLKCSKEKGITVIFD